MAQPIERKYIVQEVALIRAPRYLPALANMSAGYPVMVGAARVRTTEHLYQASKLCHHARSTVLEARTARAAKNVAYSSQELWNPEWHGMRISVMRWCLAVKLLQHWERLSPLLAGTEPLAIVEWSLRDGFWGAVPRGDGSLAGQNQLGVLWEELRARAGTSGQAAVAELAFPPGDLRGDWAWPRASGPNSQCPASR
jgi:predicted NAD-dependent protein-ADP-ribosyltransferase YbiA (DUF1768 family)